MSRRLDGGSPNLRATAFPIGADVTVEELDDDPHPTLAHLRVTEPVSWLPALSCWLVTDYELASEVMRDATTFTVDDPRFSTGQVVGPSMLTLDGAEHARHRDPFAQPFRLAEVEAPFTALVAAEADRLIDAIEPAGAAELRRSVAGPLAVAVVAHALGLAHSDAGRVLDWYDAIVATVTRVTAGEPIDEEGSAAFESLRASIEPTFERQADSSLLAAAVCSAHGLTPTEVCRTPPF